MGKFTEQGKQFEIFSPDFPYKIKLLYGFRYEYGFEMEGEPAEEIVYFCRAHGQTYRIAKNNYSFFSGKYILDEVDIDDRRDIIGIGLDVEITVDDLDEMFGDWENFAKKLKPVNDETMAELLEAVPELKAPMPDLTMEHMHTTTKSYNDLKKELDALYASSPTDTANAIDALICNLKYDKKSKKEDATKVDGKYTKVIKRGEIWKIHNTRGVGHEVQSVRPAIVISDDDRNSKLGTIMCITLEGHAVFNPDNQVAIDKNADVIAVAGKELTSTDNRAELTQVFTLDRARFITKRGELKPEKLNEVLTQFKKYYKLPNVAPEPIELDFGFDEDEE